MANHLLDSTKNMQATAITNDVIEKSIVGVIYAPQ